MTTRIEIDGVKSVITNDTAIFPDHEMKIRDKPSGTFITIPGLKLSHTSKPSYAYILSNERDSGFVVHIDNGGKIEFNTFKYHEIKIRNIRTKQK